MIVSLFVDTVLGYAGKPTVTLQRNSSVGELRWVSVFTVLDLSVTRATVTHIVELYDN